MVSVKNSLYGSFRDMKVVRDSEHGITQPVVLRYGQGEYRIGFKHPIITTVLYIKCDDSQEEIQITYEKDGQVGYAIKRPNIHTSNTSSIVDCFKQSDFEEWHQREKLEEIDKYIEDSKKLIISQPITILENQPENQPEKQKENSMNFKETAGKIMDSILAWAKRPFAFLDSLQQKLSGLCEATGIAWIFRKIAQLGKFLSKKEFVAALLGVSALKLVRVRKALRSLVGWLKNKVGDIPVAKPLVNILSKVLDAILWVDDKAFAAVASVGAWITEHVVNLINPIYEFLAGGTEDDSVEAVGE